MKSNPLKHLLLISGVALACVAGAFGQGIGLQVADTAEARTQGDADFTAGLVFGNDAAFYGLRGTANLLNELRGFVDFGVEDMERSDLTFAAQGGLLYALPVDFISDLALRAAVYYTDTDVRGVFGGNLMLVSSDETLLDNLFVYGGIGADFSSRKVEAAPEEGSTRSEVNPLVTLGLIQKITDSFSVYAEATYFDTDLFAGFGVKIR